MGILNNRLLLGIVGSIAIYWGIGGLLPNAFISQFVATSLLIFGGFAFFQNARPAWNIIVLQDRDVEWPGSHYGITGKFLISSALVFSGIFRFYVNNFDDWINWVGSLTANFSSMLIAVGMAFMFAAPQIDVRGFRIEGALRFFVALVIAFVFGCFVTSFVMGKTDDPAVIVYGYPSNRPTCPAEMPIWGSSNGKFHGPKSPYRAMVRPVMCFKTEREAADAGFVPAKLGPGQ